MEPTAPPTAPALHPLRQPPPLLFTRNSSESSPPPSPNPDLTPEQHAAELRKQRSLPVLSRISNFHPLPLDASVGNPPLRPGYVGRQVTPPSPPNSLLLHDGEPPMDSGAGRRQLPAVEPAAEQTPPSSLRDKFSRVFKGHRRGSSEATGSSLSPITVRRTRAETLSSMNTTGLGPALSRFSSRASAAPESEKPTFYAGPSLEPLSRSGSRRQVMNGGEVRIEIQPPSILPKPPRDSDQDGSTKYYNYYTGRSSVHSGDDRVAGEKWVEGADGPNDSVNYLAPASPTAEDAPRPGPHGIVRSRTAQSNYSADSQERRHAEEAASTFGFEGFHFGLAEEDEEEPGTARGSALRGAQPLDNSPRPESVLSHTGASQFYSSSGKASSSILNGPTRSNSSATGQYLMRSSSGAAGSRSTSAMAGRPTAGRNISTSSFVVGGNRVPSTSSRQSQEIARELKRLSKISAGSGMSGVAFVVAADGAGDGDTGKKWTAEEKGKGKAVPSKEPAHQRTRSEVSDWTDGQGGRSESDNDDSRSLLRESRAIESEKKLRSQEPPAGVIIHQGDQRYDFAYRMRQTSDDNPILIPQYNYVPGSSFPNRNAWTPPVAARPSKGANDSIMSRSGSSLAKPPNAYLRSPAISYPSSIAQGDGGHDSSSLKYSRSSDDVGAMVRRDSSKRLGTAASMGSLNSLGGGFHMVTSTPEATGARAVGSSLADTSSIGLAAEESFSRQPAKKQVHYDPNMERLSAIAGPALQDLPQPALFRDHLRSLPIRPGMDRRSVTPHLYAPRDIGDLNTTEGLNPNLLYKVESEAGSISPKEAASRRSREARMGRIILGLCMLFPPLLFVMASGGFDALAPGLSHGEFKRIGSTEKKIGLVVGSVVALGVTVGMIVGLSVGLTATG